MRWSGGHTFLPLDGRAKADDPFVELVRLGPAAVPALIDHLTDERPSRIVFRARERTGLVSVARDGDPPDGPPGDWEYAVSVGDLCAAALGQVVNRDYEPVRQECHTDVTRVTCVPQSKRFRDRVTKEWGKLTPEKHRDALVRDLLETTDEDVREGATLRLAFYHPAALEAAAIEFLARPTYPQSETAEFLREQLYPAKTADERRRLVDAFTAKHGGATREGVRRELFTRLASLERWEAEEDEDTVQSASARQCLADVFGLPATVTSDDRPVATPLTDEARAAFVSTLWYDRGEKLDRAVAKLLAKTDDPVLADGCIRRLVGRGFDRDIRAYLDRAYPPSGWWWTAPRPPQVTIGPAWRTWASDFQTPNSPDSIRWLRVTDRKGYLAVLGRTRLHAAVDRDQPELIAAALASGVSVNARGRDGRTALHLAAEGGNAEAVSELLAANADPNVRDADGRSAAELAAAHDATGVVRRLVADGADVADVFVAATVGDAARLADLCEADPAAVRSTIGRELTPLHVAAREGHADAIRALVAAGAEIRDQAVDVMRTDGRVNPFAPARTATPLDLAIGSGHPAAVAALLDCGAELNAKPGKTSPLHTAAAEGGVEVVRLLLARGADPRAKDRDERTPLGVAKSNGHDAVVKLLEAAR